MLYCHRGLNTNVMRDVYLSEVCTSQPKFPAELGELEISLSIAFIAFSVCEHSK